MPSAATPHPPEVAIYDLDRTLTNSGSWAPFLAHWLGTRARWRSLLLPIVAVGGLAHGLGLLSRGGLKCWSQRWLMGARVDAAQLATAAEEFAEAFAEKHVFVEARAAIAADAAAGRRLVIASASHGFYVRAIAAQLGVADVVATEAARNRGWVLSRLAGANCYGPAKRAAVEGWLAREGLEGAVLHFTSDHHSDLPCFELALARGGRVLCANPSEQLAVIAAARGWRSVRWGRIRGSFLERA